MYYNDADARIRTAAFLRKTLGARSSREENLFPKHLSHVSRCHYNAIYDSQLQNAIVLRMQLPQGATLTQPFQCDLRTLSYKAQIELRMTHNGSTNCCDFAAPIAGSRRKNGKTTIFEARFKRNFKRKIINAKIQRRICCQSTIHTSHAAITIRFRTLSCKTQ